MYYGVASVGIRYLVKRGNYLVIIYLLAITRYFRSLVISSFIKIIKMILFSILITLDFIYIYVISSPIVNNLIVLITLSFKEKDLELS